MRIHRFIAGLAAAGLCLAAAACGEIAPQESDSTQLSLSVPIKQQGQAKGSQFIKVSAPEDMSWTLDIDFGEDFDSEPWAFISENSGKGSKSGIVLDWELNAGSVTRLCTLVLSPIGVSDIAPVRVAFTQDGTGQTAWTGPETIVYEPTPDWLELPAIPAMADNGSLHYITHDMTIASGQNFRNYSYLYDTDALLALWVAYPLNKTLIGNGSRSDAWNYDPKVPRALQPTLFKGFQGGYDRGHQLPSADRLSANSSTFYSTNMTPQRGVLNQKAWATLEGMVRTWANSFDTLYVVTGADIRGSSEYAYDNEDKAVTVPVGYFKALLGYRKGGSIGITSTTGGYTAIGFYFEHRDYDNPGNSGIMKQAMTIDQLEEKLGYDFFCGLSSRTDKADYVESTLDSWWK